MQLLRKIVELTTAYHARVGHHSPNSRYAILILLLLNLPQWNGLSLQDTASFSSSIPSTQSRAVQSRSEVLPAKSDSVMTYIYNAPESRLDKRYLYHWEILRTALERTKQKYGPYRMVQSELMTEKRQAFELEHATGKLTVMYLGTIPDFERNLIPIRIPVDKNLGGYCIFLIRKEDGERFRSVKTLNDLRKFTYGLGLGWIDVHILRSNKFKVVTGSNYDGLFEMLVNKRFDVFLRAAVEIIDEYEERKEILPDLEIEKSLILYYPLPMYFWFSKTKEGKRLAARAEEGMWMMINDGTYDRIFMDYQKYKIDRLDLKHRKMFKIQNPFLVPETPFRDKRLWFDPSKY